MSLIVFVRGFLLKKSSNVRNLDISLLFLLFAFFNFIFFASVLKVNSQANTFTSQRNNYNYFSNSSAFKQEIARFEINVVRQGKDPVSIAQVPRLQKDDVLKIKLLDEQANGTKPDQSNWDWTLAVAYINPALNKDKNKSVSEEIQFRKSGWYKEYSLTVPYDSQPIFFLYSKPKYRDKLLNLVNKNADEISKIGEKSIELSDAYAKVGSFLDELQFVINRNVYGSYGSVGLYDSYGSGYGSGGSSSAYGGSNNYGYGSSYSSISPYGTTPTLDRNFYMNQSVERVARSFNITLPSCWQNSYSSYGNSYGSSYGSYSGYGTPTTTTGTPGTYYGVSQDFIARSQCVSRSVRVEDLDISVSRMLQQGGVFTASALTIKYPQLAFWINVAAAAIDTINKIKRKSPLKIVPTVNSTVDGQAQSFGYQPVQNSFTSTPSDPHPEPVKIALFAESAPSDDGFVTAYPLVIQKWQPNPDPEIMALPIPMLAEPCLHPGQNILRSTDVKTDWMTDSFTRNFLLTMSSPNGFRKQFPLKKNIGLGGWELTLTADDLNSFPKIDMTLESVITGTRGFNSLQSPPFDIPIPNGGKWEVESESQKSFAVGGKRILTLKNLIGSCKCLQSVVYKPSFGGQFVFNNLDYSTDGKNVSFEIDATTFQPGQGQLELKQYGGNISNLDVFLYPPPPNITDFKMAKGDSQAVVYGTGLDQIKVLKVNGKRALLAENSSVSLNPASNQGTALSNVPNNGYQVPANNNYSVPQNGSSISQNDSASTFELNQAPSDKTFVFEDPTARQTSDSISLEFDLGNGRTYQYPKSFSVSASRPTVVSDEAKEIDGILTGNTASVHNLETSKNNSMSGKGNRLYDLDTSTVYPLVQSEIVANLQNALTDYEFKVENIFIETRIEKSDVPSNQIPKAKFEVLDWRSLRVNFQLNEDLLKLLGGRRLQFRIHDKIRGDSDWYTIKKTFVRVPKISSIKCGKAIKDTCQITGQGIDYISQLSFDGGKTWFPETPVGLTIEQNLDGTGIATIPHFQNKSFMRIRLRDFPSQAMSFKY